MSEQPRLDLIWLPGCQAICRLGPKSAVPEWAAGRFLSTTRTADELSIVCDCDAVPDAVRQEGPYAIFRVVGSMDLGLVGILAAIAAPLAAERISIVAISTFDTDYVLVREDDRGRAESALTGAGHRFLPD
jgi:hypothetical protein